jgi:hypothetical protein
MRELCAQLATGACLVGVAGFLSSGFITALFMGGRRDNGMLIFAVAIGLVTAFVKVYSDVKKLSSSFLAKAESVVVDVGESAPTPTVGLGGERVGGEGGEAKAGEAVPSGAEAEGEQRAAVVAAGAVHEEEGVGGSGTARAESGATSAAGGGDAMQQGGAATEQGGGCDEGLTVSAAAARHMAAEAAAARQLAAQAKPSPTPID